jgi:BirA family biotin operon repressor/biotin-[acetyl-CoA-carboxylase] ligase
MDLNRAILQMLADGRFHSGQALAQLLGVSRTAVWKRVTALERMGLDVYAVRGRGYRLAAPLEILAPEQIGAALPRDVRRSVKSIEVQFETASTNQFLLDAVAVHGRVVLSEYQRAGRGRRGNRWVSPLAGGVSLSLGWHFASAPESLVLVSLLTGAAVARALNECGCTGIGLKWPNDLVAGGCKLGGVLIEARGQITGPVDLVVGVGVNVRLPASARRSVDQPVTDVAEISGMPVQRNRLAASMIAEIVRMLSGAGTGVWDEYLREWRNRDTVRGREVRLLLPGREVSGTVEGVDPSGLLMLRVAGSVQRFSSGEVSLRVAP